MRDLAKTDKNVLTINDTISGDKIELYYRLPTTEEMVDYQSHMFRRQGKKLLINAFETRLNYGLKILTGFREGASPPFSKGRDTSTLWKRGGPKTRRFF